MTSPLLGSVAKTVYGAMKNLFLDATLTRDVVAAGGDPADPPAPTPVSYPCKAIRDTYGVSFRSGGLVNEQDVKVIILQQSLSVTPIPLDRISIVGMNGQLTIVTPGAGSQPAVSADPANATWECRASS